MNIFKLSLPNNDVKRARIQDVVLDSTYPNPKINTKADPPHAGTISLNWVDTTGVPYATTKLLYSFAHGYNKMPTVFASYKYDTGLVVRRGTLPFQLGALGMISIDADAKNINLKYYSFDIFDTPIPPFIMQIRFYVMVEHGYED